MKIFGVFRGFPGLGRVVSGVSLLNELRKKGYEVSGYSYMQGKDILNNFDIKSILDQDPLVSNITEIGLNPISKVAGELINKILSEKPDLVIIDGEALLTSTLSLVYPKEKILTLLNPTDLHNSSLPESTIAFYKEHYLSSGSAIVHAPSLDPDNFKNNNSNCNLHLINTILRDEILQLKDNINKDNIVGILGGGCANSSENFYNSTLNIGEKIIETAKRLSDENFLIYCNDTKIKNRLNEKAIDLKNMEIIDNYTKPKDIYSNAKLIMCRAGRNTISELLHLQTPSILFSSKGDFRSKEQDENIDIACSINPLKMRKSSLDETTDEIINKINSLIEDQRRGSEFTPGNNRALEIIENIII